jgi:hypothetical protein
MLMPEFEAKYTQLVKAIEGPLSSQAKIEASEERFKLFYHRFKNNTLNKVVEAIERASEKTNYFPKISEVKKELDIIYQEDGAQALSREKIDQYSWFNFLMTTPPSNTKYYGHKVEGEQKNKVLARLRENEINDFEPIENCKGYQQFQTFIKQLDSGKIGNNFGQLSRIAPGLCKEAKAEARKYDREGYKAERSEYDDSGDIDPAAEKYLEEMEKVI